MQSALQIIIAARALALCMVFTLALGGCAMGPDFQPPTSPRPDSYTALPLTNPEATRDVAGGTMQRFKKGGDLPRNWWSLFHSEALDELVTAALRNNHDLKAARAALQAAHESVLANRGSFFPSLSAGFGAGRYHASTTMGPDPDIDFHTYSLFTPQLTVSYAPDLFGENRRTRESLKAREQSVRFQTIAVWNTLTTNVVVTAVHEAALRAQLRATKKLVALEQQSLDLVTLRLRQGDASKLDVSAQQAQLAQTKAGLPQLIKQLAATRHALSVLVGAFPSDSPPGTLTLADLTLPQNLPVSLPSKLVAQRPDVRQARADLHAASAEIGVAAAARLPDIQLTADIGSTALKISRVFTSGTGFWALAGSLTAPIFEGGQLKDQEAAAKADYVASAEQYRNTVLTAFQDVADTLVALQQDARTLRASAAAERAADSTLKLSRVQLRHGYIGGFQLTAAEQACQQTRIALVQAEASRFADTAALYQALGGGWWHDQDLAKQG